MKNKLLSILQKNGDSIVELKPTKEYICCTIDFNNKYIKAKKKKYVPNFNSSILVFSWSDFDFKILNPNDIGEIIPLEKVLNNGKRQEDQC